MQSVEELEKQVSKLSPQNLSKFRAWFEDFDSENWDRQFETDAKTGALDAVVKDALAEYDAGTTTEL
jgi:hypothetical protein